MFFFRHPEMDSFLREIGETSRLEPCREMPVIPEKKPEPAPVVPEQKPEPVPVVSEKQPESTSAAPKQKSPGKIAQLMAGLPRKLQEIFGKIVFWLRGNIDWPAEARTRKASGRIPWWLCGFIQWSSIIPLLIIIYRDWWTEANSLFVAMPIIAAVNSAIYIWGADGMGYFQRKRLVQYRKTGFWASLIFNVFLFLDAVWRQMSNYAEGGNKLEVSFMDDLLPPIVLAVLALLIYLAGDALAERRYLKRYAIWQNGPRAAEATSYAELTSRAWVIMICVCTALEQYGITLLYKAFEDYSFPIGIDDWNPYWRIIPVITSVIYILAAPRLNARQAREFERIRNVGYLSLRSVFPIFVILMDISLDIPVAIDESISMGLELLLSAFLIYFVGDRLARKRLMREG